MHPPPPAQAQAHAHETQAQAHAQEGRLEEIDDDELLDLEGACFAGLVNVSVNVCAKLWMLDTMPSAVELTPSQTDCAKPWMLPSGPPPVGAVVVGAGSGGFAPLGVGMPVAGVTGVVVVVSAWDVTFGGIWLYHMG